MSPRRGASLPKESDAVSVFAALSDPTRLRLLRRLSTEGPLSITRLSKGTGVTRQAITRHLYSLDAAGLVRHARRGREQVWDLELKRIEKARQYLDHVAAQWDVAAARLKAFVEGTD
jgi:DNA-binding transcriptional ArsR family regulator